MRTKKKNVESSASLTTRQEREERRKIGRVLHLTNGEGGGEGEREREGVERRRV